MCAQCIHSRCPSFMTPQLVTVAPMHPQKAHLLTFTDTLLIDFKFTDRPVRATLICKPLAKATACCFCFLKSRHQIIGFLQKFHLLPPEFTRCWKDFGLCGGDHASWCGVEFLCNLKVPHAESPAAQRPLGTCNLLHLPTLQAYPGQGSLPSSIASSGKEEVTGWGGRCWAYGLSEFLVICSWFFLGEGDTKSSTIAEIILLSLVLYFGGYF